MEECWEEEGTGFIGREREEESNTTRGSANGLELN